jgi:hypothetical protein
MTRKSEKELNEMKRNLMSIVFTMLLMVSLVNVGLGSIILGDATETRPCGEVKTSVKIDNGVILTLTGVILTFTGVILTFADKSDSPTDCGIILTD